MEKEMVETVEDQKSDRKLATIRKVRELVAIDGADMIELAKIDGWQVVVKKGEFSANDLCVYFEIDSFLPIEERYEFLRKSSFVSMYDGKEGFRLKTIKLRKQLSQGLALPLSVFPEIQQYGNCYTTNPPTYENFPKVGENVTELLKIGLYEKPLPTYLRGKILGNFPPFIPKTKQENIQNMKEILDTHANEYFEVSLKLDGSSMTVYQNDGKVHPNRNIPADVTHFGVCSRNLELKEDANNAFWKIALEFNLKSLLQEHGKNIALQGELMGPGIQGNSEKLQKIEYFVFDIWDIDNQRHFTPEERSFTIAHMNVLASVQEWQQIKHVPIIYANVTVAEIYGNNADKMQAMLFTAEGKSLSREVEREGIVFKAHKRGESGEILSFKVISNKHLLQKKE